jgi:predicted CXXCH cytochrome family protein
MLCDDTRPGSLRVIGAAVGILAAVALISCATVDRTVLVTPEIPDANFVGNQACFECHSNYTRIFPSSAHARIHIETAARVGSTGCESCHGAGSRHVAAGGGRGRFIINPGKDPAICLQCHLDTAAQFHLPQHHPVLEGKMNCVQCHDAHGLDILKPALGVGQGLARADESCAQCHREQTKPVVFAHEALREGCTTCHAPHGSINLKMLTQPDPNLCLRCHAQVQGASPGRLFIGARDHTDSISRGTCWSSGCHTAVHGSDANHHFLY